MNTVFFLNRVLLNPHRRQMRNLVCTVLLVTSLLNSGGAPKTEPDFQLLKGLQCIKVL